MYVCTYEHMPYAHVCIRVCICACTCTSTRYRYMSMYMYMYKVPPSHVCSLGPWRWELGGCQADELLRQAVSQGAPLPEAQILAPTGCCYSNNKIPYIWVYVFVYLCFHVCIFSFIYVCMHVNIYTNICSYTYTCIGVYIYSL